MPTWRDAPWLQDERRRAQDCGAPPPREGGWSPGPSAPVPPRTRWGLVFGLLGGTATFLLVLVVVAGPPAQPAAFEPHAAAPGAGTGSRTWSSGRGSTSRASSGAALQPLNVRSRFASRGVIEVWGETLAIDGTTVRIAVSARGRGRAVADAPAARRRFYARVRLPRKLRGRRVRVTARLLP